MCWTDKKINIIFASLITNIQLHLNLVSHNTRPYIDYVIAAYMLLTIQYCTIRLFLILKIYYLVEIVDYKQKYIKLTNSINV